MLVFMASKKFLSWFVLHTVLLGMSILIMFFKKRGYPLFFFLPPLLALMADWVISVHFSLLLRGDFIYLVEGLLLAIYLFLGYY